MKKILFYILITLILVSSPSIVSAQNTEVIEHFKTMQILPTLKINTPLVIEIPTLTTNNQDILVFDATQGTIEPAVIISRELPVAFTVNSSQNKASDEAALHDLSNETYVEYQLNNGNNQSLAENQVVLSFHYDKPITTNSLILTLDENVKLPDAVQIEHWTGNWADSKTSIILSKQKVADTNIEFPQTVSNNFQVFLSYSQPLRISEIAFSESVSSSSYRLRFLGQPNHAYRIYSQPQGAIPQYSTGESGDLTNRNITVFQITASESIANPAFREPDSDNDSVPDTLDNCPAIANTDQLNTNNNSFGDACEDFDQDGIMNTQDNCPNNPNRLQQDRDGDGMGDSCDPEESRLIEQLSWLPWLGIFIGFIVVIGLFSKTVKKSVKP